MSVRPLIGVSSKASLKNTLSIDGNRRSPSISKVLRPCCAKATAQLIAQKLLPSEGSALVNKNVLHISSFGNKDNAARKLRKDSAAGEPGCFTSSRIFPQLVQIGRVHVLTPVTPICRMASSDSKHFAACADRKSTRLNASHANISYADS